MDVHIRIRRWVLWWVYIGVALGAVALANIVGRDLTRRQDRIILIVGVIHWVLGGIICYACNSIRVEPSNQPPVETPVQKKAPAGDPEKEWHAASDFLFPGTRKTLLPPKY